MIKLQAIDIFFLWNTYYFFTIIWLFIHGYIIYKTNYGSSKTPVKSTKPGSNNLPDDDQNWWTKIKVFINKHGYKIVYFTGAVLLTGYIYYHWAEISAVIDGVEKHSFERIEDTNIIENDLEIYKNSVKIKTKVKMDLPSIELSLDLNVKEMKNHFNSFHERVLQRKLPIEAQGKSFLQTFNDTWELDTYKKIYSQQKMLLAICQGNFPNEICDLTIDYPPTMFLPYNRGYSSYNQLDNYAWVTQQLLLMEEFMIRMNSQSIYLGIPINAFENYNAYLYLSELHNNIMAGTTLEEREVILYENLNTFPKYLQYISIVDTNPILFNTRLYCWLSQSWNHLFPTNPSGLSLSDWRKLEIIFYLEKKTN